VDGVQPIHTICQSVRRSKFKYVVHHINSRGGR